MYVCMYVSYYVCCNAVSVFLFQRLGLAHNKKSVYLEPLLVPSHKVLVSSQKNHSDTNNRTVRIDSIICKVFNHQKRTMLTY